MAVSAASADLLCDVWAYVDDGAAWATTFFVRKVKAHTSVEAAHSWLISAEDHFADGACKVVVLSHRAPLVVLAATQAAVSAVTCLAHWTARVPWSSASTCSCACTAASWASPESSVFSSFRRRGHVSVDGGLVVFSRVLPASRAQSAWRVSWYGLSAWACCCCSAQTWKPSIPRLVDLWTGGKLSLVLDVVCANPSLTLDLALLHQADGWHLLLLFWGSCLARGALHGLTVLWVICCLQPDKFLVAPRGLQAYPQLLTNVLSEFHLLAQDKLKGDQDFNCFHFISHGPPVCCEVSFVCWRAPCGRS